jgi:hypothetical protein
MRIEAGIALVSLVAGCASPSGTASVGSSPEQGATESHVLALTKITSVTLPTGRTVSFFGTDDNRAYALTAKGGPDIQTLPQMRKIQPTVLYNLLTDEPAPARLAALETSVLGSGHSPWSLNPDPEVSAQIVAEVQGLRPPSDAVRINAVTGTCSNVINDFVHEESYAAYIFNRWNWWNGLYFNYTTPFDWVGDQIYQEVCALVGPFVFTVAGVESVTVSSPGEWYYAAQWTDFGQVSTNMTITNASGKEFDYYAADTQF